jgi:hypothetical protein
MEQPFSLRPDRLLQLVKDNPDTPLRELVNQQPRRCIDPLFITLLSLSMETPPQIYSPIASNPLLPPGNKGITDLPDHKDDRPILIDASTTPSKMIEPHLAQADHPPILMITTQEAWRGLQPVAEIPPKTIPVLTASFWQGTTRSYSEPFAHSLFVYCTSEIDQLMVKEAIHAVSILPNPTPPSYTSIHASHPPAHSGRIP